LLKRVGGGWGGTKIINFRGLGKANHNPEKINEGNNKARYQSKRRRRIMKYLVLDLSYSKRKGKGSQGDLAEKSPFIMGDWPSKKGFPFCKKGRRVVYNSLRDIFGRAPSKKTLPHCIVPKGS